MKLWVASLTVAGLLGGPCIMRAEEKPTECKGTLTLDGKTYKLESALAYETTKFGKNETVIYLSE